MRLKKKIASLGWALPLLSGLTYGEQAGDAANFSYHSPGKAQTPAEIADLGVIAPAGEATNEGDGKSAPPPPTTPPLKSKFRFNVTTRGEFTSNAKMTDDHSSADFIFLPTLEAGYNTPLGKYFTFDLSTKVEAAAYADNNDRGFFGYSANATLDYRPFTGLPRVYVSAEPYYYDNFDTGQRLTSALGLYAGTDWGHAFNNGRSLIFAGYNYAHYFADPGLDDRNAHRLVAGIAHQLRSNLTAQLFYSWQYTDYTDVVRHDSRNQVGLNFVYQVSEHLFGSFTSSYVDNQSDMLHGSYQTVTASLGLTLQF